MANYGNSTDNELMKNDKEEVMALPESEEQRIKKLIYKEKEQ
jgi:hypothetical protein